MAEQGAAQATDEDEFEFKGLPDIEVLEAWWKQRVLAAKYEAEAEPERQLLAIVSGWAWLGVSVLLAIFWIAYLTVTLPPPSSPLVWAGIPALALFVRHEASAARAANARSGNRPVA